MIYDYNNEETIDYVVMMQEYKKYSVNSAILKREKIVNCNTLIDSQLGGLIFCVSSKMV